MKKKNGLNGVRKIGLILLIMITAMSGTFATSAWIEASNIATDNLALVPTYTTVTYAETNGAGVQLLEFKGLIIHGEDGNANLTVREIGSSEMYDLLGTFTDGMAFFPFASDVEIDNYQLIDESVLIEGVLTTQYYFEAFVADNAIAKSLTSYEEEGAEVSIIGYIYISNRDGSVVKLEQEYSLYDNYTGSFEIEQEVYFDYDGQRWVAIVSETSGELTHTLSNKSVELTSFNVTEEFSDYFTADTYMR